MASRQEHNEDGREVAERWLGRKLTYDELAIVDEVNERLDQFAHWPKIEFLSRHRKFLHHEEGVDYFRRRYGQLGAIVAVAHIMKDCGHVPKAVDYYNGKVDRYGGEV